MSFAKFMCFMAGLALAGLIDEMIKGEWWWCIYLTAYLYFVLPYLWREPSFPR